MPTETLAGDCELARCAKFDVVYYLKMPQIIALIEQSAECRQFIKLFLMVSANQNQIQFCFKKCSLKNMELALC